MEACISFFSKILEKGAFGQDANVPKSITKKRKKFTPKSLPQIRPRSLSLSSEEDRRKTFFHISGENERIPSARQYVCDQRQSRLLASLPVELRIKIWTYVLVPADLHVVRGEGRLLTIKCLGAEARHRYPPCQHRCWGSAMKPFLWYRGVSPGYCVGSRGCEWYTGAVPLLQACRSIYTEAVPILYHENIFRFNHVDTVITLSRTILPCRLNSIRVVHLAHSFPFSMYGPDSRKTVVPYDAKTWEETCQVLASMSNLEELYMHLGEFCSSEIHEVLAPLHKIRQPRVFELFIGLRSNPAELYKIADRPFRLVRQLEWGMADRSEEWICC